MDYKYKDALERAKKLKETCDNTAVIGWCEYIFPELRESEDERVRKGLVKAVSGTLEGNKLFGTDVTREEALAWLEKQCEHANFRNKIQVGDKVTRNEAGILVNISQLNRIAKPRVTKSVDKVEPKFKVGDWCIDNEDGTIFQIVKVLDNTYTYKTNVGEEYSCTHYSLENDAKLWTIQDAKDGDFLACPMPKGGGEQVFIFKEIGKREYIDDCIEYYCRVCCDKFYESNCGYMGTTSNVFTPATSEQRTLLIQKMHEAGYEWNSDKKELEKKPQRMVSAEAKETILADIPFGAKDSELMEATYFIPQGFHAEIEGNKVVIKKGEQKSAWSKEDGRNLQGIIDEIEANKNNAPDDDLPTYDRFLSWLKSLKDRYTWKPSDEQMVVLELACKYERAFTPKQIDILIGLKEQLKKLKGH